METATKYDIKVDGTMEGLPAITDFIEATIENLGIEDPLAFNIKLAIDEITTNVVKHAYLDKKGSIWVTCFVKDGYFHAIIRDQGPPFDPSKMPPPDLTLELEKRSVGGLGIYFVRRVMDSLSHEYRDGMNVVTMTKKIS